MGDLEVFQSYLDESENSTGAVYAVGGFVGKKGVWDKLEPEWLKCIPPQVTAFHATDCVTGNNEFEGIDIPDRIAILDKLTNVIAAHEVQLVGYGIDAKTYRSLAPNKKQNEFLANKYAAPFGGTVELACKAMGNVPGPDEVWKVLEEGETWAQCDFFIENNEYSPSASRTIAGMRNAKDLWFRSRIGKDSYGEKSGPKGVSLLQVADLGAFLTVKHISKAAEGKISWKVYYEKLRSAKRVYAMVVADEYSLKRLHEMFREIQKEAAEGRDPWEAI
jgi:hypothetical protein